MLTQIRVDEAGIAGRLTMVVTCKPRGVLIADSTMSKSLHGLATSCGVASEKCERPASVSAVGAASFGSSL